MTVIPFTVRPRCGGLPLAVELCRLHQMTAALGRCAAEADADLSQDPVARIERHKAPGPRRLRQLPAHGRCPGLLEDGEAFGDATRRP